jgi:aspartate/methionine/tyrosine aminotransferase
MYEGLAPGQVLVHSGAEEAIFNFMHAVLRPGDHVVAHWPCYQSLHQVAESLGCEVSPWMTTHEEGWNLDMDRLKTVLRPSTRVVVVNSPHNPTGALMGPETAAELNRLSEVHGFIVFSDEVYRGLEYDPSSGRRPSATSPNGRSAWA